MKEDSDSVGAKNGFLSGSGFPTTDTPEPDPEPLYGYEHCVMEPRAVEHSFPDPGVPNAPKTREDFEPCCVGYAKHVLHEYNEELPLEWDRVRVLHTGRFKRALGKCGADGYHTSRVRISWKHYNEKGYNWDRMKETIRHELVHAWQARWLGYTSHGPTFVQKAEELDCNRLDRYDGIMEPKYVMVCQNCGNTYTRDRMCKAVRRTDYYKCSACGMVERDFNHSEETDGLWNSYHNTEWRKVL